MGKDAAAESKAWKAARDQIIREGSPLDLQSIFAEQEARGNIVRSSEESDFDPDDLESTDALDAEVDLSDEDGVQNDDFESAPDGFSGVGIFPDHLDDGEGSQVTMGAKFELLVSDGRCVVQRPRWMRARALNDDGEEFLDEVGGRMGVMEAVGRWLTETRPAFLQEPAPWHLGVDALKELEQGMPSVTEKGFQQLSGIKGSQFTRYKKHCFLTWEDATLPLGFLFSSEAKLAWVANALIQRSEKLKDPITKKILDRVKSLTTPKGKPKTDSLKAKAIGDLGFSEFIQRVNLDAGTAWSQVLEQYENEILTLTARK